MRSTGVSILRRREQDPDAGLSEASFLELYVQSWEALLRFFARRTLAPDIAVELTAETFAEVFARRSRFDPSRGDARAWLFGVGRMKLADYLRRDQIDRRARDRLGLASPELSGEEYDRVEAMIDFADVGRRLSTALTELPRGYREAVVCRVLDEMSYDDIATRLGCSPAAARTRVSRGLATLARLLASDNPRVATKEM